MDIRDLRFMPRIMEWVNGIFTIYDLWESADFGHGSGGCLYSG